MDQLPFAEKYFRQRIAFTSTVGLEHQLPRKPEEWLVPWAGRALSSFILDNSLTPEQTWEVFDYFQKTICPKNDSPVSLDDVVRLDDFQKSCLSCAIKAGNAAAACWLLHNKKADIEKPDNDGLRPVHQAALASRKIALLLIEAGTDFRATDEEGENLFHYFAYRAWDSDYERLGLELRARGLAPNLPNHEGQTPLHKCLEKGYEDAACWLIKTFGLRACVGDPFSELRHAAIEGECPAALRMIEEIARADADKQALEAATGCDSERMARFGRLAQTLIEQGALQLNGQPLSSLDELAEAASKTLSPRPGL